MPTKRKKTFELPEDWDVPRATVELNQTVSAITLDDIYAPMGITAHNVIQWFRVDSDDVDVRTSDLVRAYDALPDSKKPDTIDGLLELDHRAPQMTSADLFAHIGKSIYRRNMAKAVNIVSNNLDKLVEQSLLTALGEGDLAQRERLEYLRQHGILPTPKGATITNISLSATAIAAASAKALGAPSFEDDVSDDDIQLQLSDGGVFIQTPEVTETVEVDLE